MRLVVITFIILRSNKFKKFFSDFKVSCDIISMALLPDASTDFLKR